MVDDLIGEAIEVTANVVIDLWGSLLGKNKNKQKKQQPKAPKQQIQSVTKRQAQQRNSEVVTASDYYKGKKQKNKPKLTVHHLPEALVIEHFGSRYWCAGNNK